MMNADMARLTSHVTRRDALRMLGAGAVSAGLSLLACRQVGRRDEAQIPEPTWGHAAERADIIVRDVTVPLGADSMSCILAHPAGGARCAPVIVIHANWLVEPYIRDVTAMLAAAGFAALAVDLFHFYPHVASWEDARRVPGSVTSSLLAANFRERRMVGDLQAAIDYLQQQSFVAPVGTGLVGFCGGGWNALLMAAQSQDVGAVVALYTPVREGDVQHRAPLALLPYIAAPVQYHQPEKDDYVPVADVAAFERGMLERGRHFERYTYPGAQHGFFAYDREPVFDAANARLAWMRMVPFLREHLRSRPLHHDLAPQSVGMHTHTEVLGQGTALSLHRHE